MKLKRITLILSIAVALFASCAEEMSEHPLNSQIRQREAWLRVYYPDVTVDEHGLYRLSLDLGHGSIPHDSSYIFYNITTRSLDGTYLQTNNEELAKKIRAYNTSTHYVPYISHLNSYELYDALENEFRSIPVGTKISLLMPPEWTFISYPPEYLKLYGLTNSIQNSENEIYEIELVNFVTDLQQHEIQILENYGHERYLSEMGGRIDSTSYGFYFVKTKKNLNPADTLTDGDVLQVSYVGKYLDDFCFDTNIVDSAKFYRMYDPSKEYETLEVTYYKDPKMISEGSGVVRGFANIVSQLKNDEAGVGFFISDLGYGKDGKGDIRGYSPLVFYVEVNNGVPKR